MRKKDALRTELEVYQRQCFCPETGKYIGFQCPENDPYCSIKAADGMEILPALAAVGGLIELDHCDSSRFSKTGTTYPEQVVARCKKCHTARHANDPSASRVKWIK